jgi:hypothetical protein
MLQGMATQPSFAAAWLRQRQVGDAAVAEVERSELAGLTDVEALAIAEAVLAAAPLATMTADRVASSGFVEQQRLFARTR